MPTLYLINNKESEPAFPDGFIRAAKKNNYIFTQIEARDLSYYVQKDSDKIAIFHKDIELAVTSDDLFYIRARKPHASTTALLCFVLDACEYTFNERRDSLEHNIRGSKMAQGFLCKPHSINFPNSLAANLENRTSIYTLLDQHFSYPLVAKQSGSKGEKVWKCDTQEELHNLITILDEGTNKLVLFQEYIENTFDIRSIVHHGEIIASIARSSNDGFYNNVSQGGSAEAIELTEEEQRISLKAAELTKLDLAGIDIVRSDHGPLLFEINKAPDISCFSEAAGYDLSEAIAEKFITEHK